MGDSSEQIPNRPPLNLELLRQRAHEVREGLRLLSAFAELPVETFLERSEARDAAKYRLIVVIEAAISICNHLASRLAAGLPDNYAACFATLAAEGIIGEPLATRLGQMARFRNLLVHLYGQVDDRRVWRFLSDGRADLEAYLDAVHRFAEGDDEGRAAASRL